jgi:Fe-S cluster assembly protein SufD
MSVLIEDKSGLRSTFERFASAHAGSDPAWLRARRTAAFARFVEKGLPGPRDEGWRQTPVAPLTRTRFEPAEPAAPYPDFEARLPSLSPASVRIVFVNGRFSPSLSTLAGVGAGVRVGCLRQRLAQDGALLEARLGRVLADDASVFCDLNTAFAEDGAVVELAPGTVLREPVHVVHVAAPSEQPTVSYVRTLVVAGRGSEAALVESFAGPDGGVYLVNSVSEIVLEDGARIDRYKLQQDGSLGLHLATLACRLGRDARFVDHAFSLGAAFSRNDIDLRFEAEGGEGVLNGLFALDGRRFCDTHSRVDHAVPHCTSRQLYKGVLDQQSRGVFNGLVVVRKDAQKTDASQTNRNLLLSREALVHSTPQLVIRADDVKCRHGSTTGQLDPTALFYLRSRGIGEAAARSLLTWAFASDLLREVRLHGVRAAAEQHLQGRLPGAAGLQEALP